MQARALFVGIASAALALALSGAVPFFVSRPCPLEVAQTVPTLKPGDVLTEKELEKRVAIAEARSAACKKWFKETPWYQMDVSWYFAFLSPAFLIVLGLSTRKLTGLGLVLVCAPTLPPCCFWAQSCTAFFYWRRSPHSSVILAGEVVEPIAA
jgi:hypothetical protein